MGRDAIKIFLKTKKKQWEGKVYWCWPEWRFPLVGHKTLIACTHDVTSLHTTHSISREHLSSVGAGTGRQLRQRLAALSPASAGLCRPCRFLPAPAGQRSSLDRTVHTKRKVVNEKNGAYFNNPESKTRTKGCHLDNTKVVTGLSLRRCLFHNSFWLSKLTTLTTFWMTTIKLFYWQPFWQLVDNLAFCVYIPIEKIIGIS